MQAERVNDGNATFSIGADCQRKFRAFTERLSQHNLGNRAVN
jgi:hypothetical protein